MAPPPFPYPLLPPLRASPYRLPQGSSARFERGQVLSSAAVSAAPSVCSPGVGGDAPGPRPLFPARLAPSLGKSRRPSIHPSLDRLPCPWGVDSMVSSGPALCEVGRRGLSADGFRRAGLALCEAGVDFVERTWTYVSRVRLAPAPARTTPVPAAPARESAQDRCGTGPSPSPSCPDRVREIAG